MKRSTAPIETAIFAVVGLVAVFAYLLADPGVPVIVQVGVIAILVAVLGLPHGALDPMIARRLGLWRGPRSAVAFTTAYVGLSAIVIGLWLLAPVASLIGFLLISAAHFGGDWNAGRPAALRFLTGAALLSLPSLGDADAVAELYVVLAGPEAAAIATVQAAIGPLLLVGLVVAAALAAQRRPHEGLELVVVAALALTTPPLVFFILYFCLLHSARHLREGFQEERGVLPSRATIAIVVGATVVPILAAGAFLLATSGTSALDDRLLQVVFIGLAALTVPHMLLVTLGDRARRASADDTAAAVSAPPPPAAATVSRRSDAG